MQLLDCLFGVGLDDVGNHDVTGVFAVNCHVDDCAYAVAVDEVDAQLLHELVVAGSDRNTVDLCKNASAADLFNVRDAAAVNFLAICFLQALADGVRRGTLGKRRILEKLFLLHRAVVNGADLKHAFRQRAGLIEDDGLDLRECFQIVGALDQHAFLACPADAGKEAQGDAHNERARAAGNKECKRPVNPLLPFSAAAHRKARHRRNNCQRQRAVADSGGIDAGKFCDEILGSRLAGAGVFDKLENFGDCRLAEFLRRADFQDARHVDAAADNLVAGLCIARQALAGQGAGVERGRAIDDHTVERNLFARLDDDHRADRHFVRVHLFKLSVHLDVCVVRTDIHERGNIFAALADGIALEEFADLVKQHDGDCLVVVAAFFVDGEGKRTDGRDCHQKVLVEHTTVPDALGSFFENIKANDKVRGKVQREAGNSRDGEKLQGNEHHGADENAREHLFLFLCHGEQLLLSLSKCLIVWAKAAPQNGAQFSMASYSSISQSGSTFLQALRTSFITDLASAPSANSTIIFCVMKLTVAFATPSVLLAASSMRLAQLAQSTSIA